MAENSPSDDRPIDLTRQVQTHLDALRSAGVEWVAQPEPLELSPPPPTEAPSPPVAAGSLFDEAAPDLARQSPEKRLHELTVLDQEVKHCTRCRELVVRRTNTVFGVGPIDPDICFVGEAPGEQEDKRGEPFVGPAGQLLTKMIEACGLKRSEVYILNTLKCRPPGNRDPKPEETANCRGFLERQFDLIRPKFVCALGRIAAQNLLGTTTSLGKLRRKVHHFRGVPVMCTYHPSYLLRYPEGKKEAWEDLKLMLKEMGKPIPGAKG